MILLTKPGSGDASRKLVAKAGGGCPPEGMAGRLILHVRALISPSFDPVGLCLKLEPRGRVNVVSLMAESRERHWGGGYLPPCSHCPLSFRICFACVPS